MPTKHLKMVVRKSPCGEGSKTWDRYEMRVNSLIYNIDSQKSYWFPLSFGCVQEGHFNECEFRN